LFFRSYGKESAGGRLWAHILQPEHRLNMRADPRLSLPMAKFATESVRTTLIAPSSMFTSIPHNPGLIDLVSQFRARQDVGSVVILMAPCWDIPN